MTAKTKQQLSTSVLEQLREIGSGQDPDADDADLIERRYDAKLSEWRDRGVAWWPNTNRSTAEIPLVVFQIVVDLMENEVMHQFGRDNPTVQRRLMEEQLLGHLRRHLAKPPSGESTTVTNY